jgi:azobenzene reductase
MMYGFLSLPAEVRIFDLSYDEDRGTLQAKDGMNMKVTLLAGSNRKDAASTKLLRYIGKQLQAKGFTIALIDLWETPLPFFSADEESPHPHVKRLLQAVSEADGLIFGTPEYHGSVSGVLKNALDYLGSDVVGGKPVLSAGSSGGAIGVSSLTQLQAIVRNLHGINSPEWISLGGDQRRFGIDGAPMDAMMRKRVERAIDQFAALIIALKAGVATMKIEQLDHFVLGDSGSVLYCINANNGNYPTFR